jgi:transcriptional regulator with XRE-family HTH domain
VNRLRGTFRSLLEQNNTTQETFAHAIGIAPSTLSKKLNGHLPPPTPDEARQWSRDAGWSDGNAQLLVTALDSDDVDNNPLADAKLRTIAGILSDATASEVLKHELLPEGAVQRLMHSLSRADSREAEMLTNVVRLLCDHVDGHNPTPSPRLKRRCRAPDHQCK